MEAYIIYAFPIAAFFISVTTLVLNFTGSKKLREEISALKKEVAELKESLAASEAARVELIAENVQLMKQLVEKKPGKS